MRALVLKLLPIESEHYATGQMRVRHDGSRIMSNFIDMGMGHAQSPRRTEVKSARPVVDNDLGTVHAMAMLVKAFGHEVEFTINGLAAIDIAREILS
jgi:hypothetical protein